MGLNVNLYAGGSRVADDALAAAETFISARLYGPPEYNGRWLERSSYYPNRIEFNTLERYYGPGYERGDWPVIYGRIVLMRAALPSLRVHYGSDSDDDAPEADDVYLADIWNHFLSPHGADYRTRP